MWRFETVQRPVVWATLCFSFGILLECYTDFFHPLLTFCILLLIFFYLILVKGWRLFFLLCCLFLIFFGILYSNAMKQNGDLSVELQSGKGYLEGHVVSFVDERVKGKRRKIIFDLESSGWWQPKLGRLEGSILRREVRGKVRVTVIQPNRVPQINDRVRVFGELSRPREIMNLGEFDYKEYLSQRGINSVLLSVAKKNVLILSYKASGISPYLSRLRISFEKHLDKIFQMPESALFKALLTGNKKNIPKDIIEDFRNTGTIHVLVISGFHISLIVGGCYFLFLLMGFSRKSAAFFCCCVILIYVPFVGSQIPIVRAGIMIFAVMVGVLIQRKSEVVSNIFLALFLILLMNPQSLFSPSLQLSFVAVAFLIFITPELERYFILFDVHSHFINQQPVTKNVIRFFLSTAIASIVVFFGLWPLILWYFNMVTVTSLISNLIIVPILIFSLMLLFFILPLSFVSLPLGILLGKLPASLLQGALVVVDVLSVASNSYFYLSRPSLMLVVMYYSCFVCFCFQSYRQWELWKKSMLIFSIVIISVCMLVPWSQYQKSVVFLYHGKAPILILKEKPFESSLINLGPKNKNSICSILKYWGIRSLEDVWVTSKNKNYWGSLEKLTNYGFVRTLHFPWPYPKDEMFMRSIKAIKKDKGSLKNILTPGNEKNMVLPLKKEMGVILDFEGVRICVLDYKDNSFIRSLNSFFDVLYLHDSISHVEDPVISSILDLKPKQILILKISSEVRELFERQGVGVFEFNRDGGLKLTKMRDGYAINPMRR